MDQALRSFHSFDLTRADEDSGEITAVISTADVARDGAIIEINGWDFANYLRNPVVLWGHDDGAGFNSTPSGGLPIARTTSIGIEGDKVVATARFDLDDPFAAQVYRKIRDGFIRSTSVRWRPLQVGRRKAEVDGKERDVLVFERQELLEWSPVSVPADPGAVIMRSDGSPFTLEDNAPDLLTVARQLSDLLLEVDRIDGPERDEMSGLYRSLGDRLVAAPEVRSEAIDALEAAMVAAAERMSRPFDPTTSVVKVIARITGRTETDLMKRLET